MMLLAAGLGAARRPQAAKRLEYMEVLHACCCC